MIGYVDVCGKCLVGGVVRNTAGFGKAGCVKKIAIEKTAVTFSASAFCLSSSVHGSFPLVA